MKYNTPIVNSIQRTFFEVPKCNDLNQFDAHVGFLGIPYDGGVNTPWSQTGQSRGPNAVRDTLLTCNFPITELGLYDIDMGKVLLQGVTMLDCGDVNFYGNDSIANINKITEAARIIVNNGGVLVSVGGDHSITFPLIRAFDKYESIDVIQFDAHLDQIDSYDNFGGGQFSHGTPMYRSSEIPFVKDIASIGVRTTTIFDIQAADSYGVKYVTPRQAMKEGAAALAERIVNKGRDVYVTIDTDCLDAPYVPGTCKPEPGGLQYEFLIETLEEIAKRANVVGFDVVELTPSVDPRGFTAQITAWIILKFLGYIFEYNSLIANKG